MRFQLEPTLNVGKRQVAIISQIKTHHRQLGKSVFIHGGKRPVFVLVKDGVLHEAFDISGTRVAPSEVYAQCPDLATRFYDNS